MGLFMARDRTSPPALPCCAVCICYTSRMGLTDFLAPDSPLAQVVAKLTQVAEAVQTPQVARPPVVTPAQSARVELAKPLLDFQAEDVELFFSRFGGRGIFGHEMGLGKTPMGVGVVVKANVWPALVVCPPSLTLNWQSELTVFAPQLTTHVITGVKPYPLPRGVDVYIIGDAVLTQWRDALAAARLQALIVDESQRFKNYKAGRAASLVTVARSIPRRNPVALLTGTAIINRPQELLNQVVILGLVDKVFGGFGYFLNRYCPVTDRWGTRGAANVAELHDTMRQRFYIRRERATTLNLPGKGRNSVLVPLGHDRAAAAYKAVEADYLAWRALPPKMRFLRMKEGRGYFGKLRKLIGPAKVAATVAYVKDLLANDEQVFVACWHRDVTDALAKALDAVRIEGGMSTAAKQESVRKFQSGEAKVLVGNIIAAGTGFTLTAAHHIVVAEMPVTPGDLQQVEDRLDRIGQTEFVTSHVLMAESVIDPKLWGIILRKLPVVDGVNRGTVGDYDFNETAVMDEFLGLNEKEAA